MEVPYASRAPCHHSLVTPIDWKHGSCLLFGKRYLFRHHSLVTPIDWKLVGCTFELIDAEQQVTTRW